RLRHGDRPHRHAEIRHARPALLLRKRPALAPPLRLPRAGPADGAWGLERVKRDPDYIRQLLLEFEAAEGWRIRHSTRQSMSKDHEKRDYHIRLMIDQGLIETVGRDMLRLHSSAHDALDAIRDQTVWAAAK